MTTLRIPTAAIACGPGRARRDVVARRVQPRAAARTAPLRRGRFTLSSPIHVLSTPLPLGVRAQAAASNDTTSFHAIDAPDLEEYICKGPLLQRCGLSEDIVRENIGYWKELGAQLAKNLEFDVESISESERIRLYHYYIPTFLWCKNQLEAHKEQYRESGATDSPPALVIGISAPQGCGKTTIVEQLEALFTYERQVAASVSIDDFYLTNADQQALAASHPGNGLLQYRGNAGSHDMKLAVDTLDALMQCRGPGEAAVTPRYDKSLMSGRGDRAPQDAWPVVQGPVDVVLLEGWMLGFTPVTEEQAREINPQLVEVNRFLGQYGAWDARVDSWVVVQVGDPRWVYSWRLQAEERMQSSGKSGMSSDEVSDFVSRFMPAYKAYLPGLYTVGPPGGVEGRTLEIMIDEGRAPILLAGKKKVN